MCAKKKRKFSFINLFFPTIVLGAVTGIMTSCIVNLYKFAAKHVIHFSEEVYASLGERPWIIPVVLIALAVIALLIVFVQRKEPDLKGSGIPTAIAALRGMISLKWLRNLVGSFVLSLLSFLIGVPLGSEGPAVQMGTAVGGGVSKLWEKKHKAWERYSMTSGACAGFAVATGAPVSGVVFAIEEAHRKISPMLLLSSASSVLFAGITTEVLAPVLSVSRTLFPFHKLPVLSVRELYVPVIAALSCGAFAVVFLKMYKQLDNFYNKKLGNAAPYLKILAIFVFTFIAGAISVDFISTGHELVLHLFDSSVPLLCLSAVVVIRTALTLSANSNGITGGTFIPLLAIGAAFSALVAKVGMGFFGLDSKYYVIFLVFGLISCISAMMKMPLTAVVFAVEALGCGENIVYVILVAMVSYLITEIFAVKSVSDIALEKREEAYFSDGNMKMFEMSVTVSEGSFAAGRDASDILWPHGVTVIYIEHKEEAAGGAIFAGDVLKLRCTSNDENALKNELYAIVGEQRKESVWNRNIIRL